MTDQQIKIDPEKFAYHFMNTIERPEVDSEHLEVAAKESLAAYLTAYYLAQRFNNLENNFFVDNQEKHVSTYQRILSELNQY